VFEDLEVKLSGEVGQPATSAGAECLFFLFESRLSTV